MSIANSKRRTKKDAQYIAAVKLSDLKYEINSDFKQNEEKYQIMEKSLNNVPTSLEAASIIDASISKINFISRYFIKNCFPQLIDVISTYCKEDAVILETLVDELKKSLSTINLSLQSSSKAISLLEVEKEEYRLKTIELARMLNLACLTNTNTDTNTDDARRRGENQDRSDNMIDESSILEPTNRGTRTRTLTESSHTFQNYLRLIEEDAFEATRGSNTSILSSEEHSRDRDSKNDLSSIETRDRSSSFSDDKRRHSKAYLDIQSLFNTSTEKKSNENIQAAISEQYILQNTLAHASLLKDQRNKSKEYFKEVVNIPQLEKQIEDLKKLLRDAKTKKSLGDQRLENLEKERARIALIPLNKAASKIQSRARKILYKKSKSAKIIQKLFKIITLKMKIYKSILRRAKAQWALLIITASIRNYCLKKVRKIRSARQLQSWLRTSRFRWLIGCRIVNMRKILFKKIVEVSAKLLNDYEKRMSRLEYILTYVTPEKLHEESNKFFDYYHSKSPPAAQVENLPCWKGLGDLRALSTSLKSRLQISENLTGTMKAASNANLRISQLAASKNLSPALSKSIL